MAMDMAILEVRTVLAGAGPRSYRGHRHLREGHRSHAFRPIKFGHRFPLA